MEVAISINKVPIRLTEERWIHIVENHDDLAGYLDTILAIIENPDYIIQGYRDALIGLKELRKDKFLAVVYKEIAQTDGFVITAYFSNKIKIEEERILWKRK